MAEWITDVDNDTARLQRWNKGRGVKRIGKVLDDPANQVPAVIYLLFNQPLTDPQCNALEQLLTDDTMSDAQSKTYLTTLRSLVSACSVEGGIKAPADLVALPDKVWRVSGELRLRCDDAPPEVPPE